MAQDELAGPGLPEDGAHVWRWFLELNQARNSSGFGPESIAYQEVDAWARLTRRNPRAHEVMWLLALDRFWRLGPSKENGT